MEKALGSKIPIGPAFFSILKKKTKGTLEAWKAG